MSSTSLDFGSIIKAIAGSIAQVMFLSVAGYMLVRLKIISSKCRAGFNEANNCFFTPCFIFGKVAFGLKSEQIIKLWVVPVTFVVVTCFSALLAYIPGRMFRLRKSDRNFCMAVSMYMNSNSLPIALVMALLETSGDKNGFEWALGDSEELQTARSLSYFIIYSTLGLILRWSYGVKQLAVPVEEDPIETKTSSKEDLTMESASNTKLNINHVELLNDHQARPRWKTASQSILRKGVLRPLKVIYGFMNPTLYASALSLFVVAIPRLQTWLEGIKPLRGAFRLSGNVSVPLTMVVLGAYFYSEKISPEELKEPEESKEPESKPNRSIDAMDAPKSLEADLPVKTSEARLERTIMLIAIFARQIICPLVLFPIFFLIRHVVSRSLTRDPPQSPMEGSAIHDPCFTLVMILLIGSPPAITLVQMTVTNKFPAGSSAYIRQEIQSLRFQHLISRTLFASYIFVTPVVTVICVLIAAVIVNATD